MKIKITLLLVVAMFFAMNTNAQTPDRKWGVGLNFGANQYSGDYGNGFYNFDQALYGFGGLTIARNLTEHFDVELNASFGDVGYNENSNNHFRYSLAQVHLNAKYNFFKYEDVKLRPFVFAGIGYMNFSDKNSNNVIENMALPDFGVGVNYHITPAISIMFKETFVYSDFDNIDNEKGSYNDSYLQHTLGVVFNLGKAKDTDGDGISNRKDNCPEVAGLALFNGCPDTDEDGIVDAEDACPTVKGLEAFKGCPDTDSDGITDAEDGCPKVAGTVAFKGCPDTDDDGIADADDACPNVKGLATMNGCPDTDGDGISDAKDSCPNVAGIKNMKGCPDSDKDGISDANDLCPQVAGTSKNKGCPEIKAEENEVLLRALHGVKFQSGKDILTKSSYDILNNVVTILSANSKYNLDIKGFTDSQGDENKNLQLSKRRAKQVMQYIIDKGVNASRLSSEGYGEVLPVATNNTANGRAMNRRVELKLEY